MPAVVVAEYLRGVLTDADPVQGCGSKRAFLEDLLEDRARRRLRLEGCQRSTLACSTHTPAANGQPRGVHDLIIAATARAWRRTVVTTDVRARFGELPEVDELLLAG